MSNCESKRNLYRSVAITLFLAIITTTFCFVRFGIVRSSEWREIRVSDHRAIDVIRQLKLPAAESKIQLMELNPGSNRIALYVALDHNAAASFVQDVTGNRLGYPELVNAIRSDDYAIAPTDWKLPNREKRALKFLSKPLPTTQIHLWATERFSFVVVIDDPGEI